MTRRIAGFSHRSRSLSMPIPYATQSDSVRDPVRFRTRTAKTYIDTIKGQFNIAIELPLHILL